MRRLLLGGVLALALTGCTDDEPTSTERTTTTSTSTTTSTIQPTTTTTVPPRVVAPATPEEAVAAIRAGEAAVHDPASGGTALARAVLGEQLALRAVADHPDWDAPVSALLPAELRRGVDDDVRANREIRSLVARPKDTLPPWRIVDPKPADELQRYYQDAAATTGVPWEYLAAVHLVETRMGRLRGTSTAGAQGPMQFLPSTWAAYGKGGDINDDRDAILGAANYLAANGGGTGRMANALWNYNHSDRYVAAVTLYAERMRADPAAYRGYHQWQVVYWTTLGDVVLPVGYTATTTQPVTPAAIAALGAGA